ncbi:conserved hypothetical protein [Flavobacterium sp. 9AF]|uniref:hypothetical protein n=1 Tax=Flavobacterium sp. 9AF TaxID=2653142 RepID=UPI0012EFD0F4|nr:hypothetical protein [Flavobacterium sp. 9AF]VXC41482.1 conserved hypothetical protein [Flavobacterium sp. 9AF]
MDFYKNNIGINKVRIGVIIASVFLLAINIYLSISENEIKYLAIIANLLLILGMFMSIKNSKKQNS